MDLVSLSPRQAESARAVYNHWVRRSTATFHTDPLGAEEFAAEVFFADPRYGAWAVEDGGFAGYVVLAPYKARCAYRDSAEVSIYLAPDATGRGLGGPSLEHAEAHARAHGLHTLLATICAENEPSRRLFTRHGYAEAGRLREVGRKFGRLLDVLLLQKLLSVESQP